MVLWLKKYGIAAALAVLILVIVAWVTAAMLSRPVREPTEPDADTSTVEKSFSVEPKAEVTVTIEEK